MVADLLNKKPIALVRSDIFERLAQERIEWFGNTSDGGSVFTCGIGGDINQSLH